MKEEDAELAGEMSGTSLPGRYLGFDDAIYAPLGCSRSSRRRAPVELPPVGPAPVVSTPRSASIAPTRSSSGWWKRWPGSSRRRRGGDRRRRDPCPLRRGGAGPGLEHQPVLVLRFEEDEAAVRRIRGVMEGAVERARAAAAGDPLRDLPQSIFLGLLQARPSSSREHSGTSSSPSASSGSTNPSWRSTCCSTSDAGRRPLLPALRDRLDRVVPFSPPGSVAAPSAWDAAISVCPRRLDPTASSGSPSTRPSRRAHVRRRRRALPRPDTLLLLANLRFRHKADPDRSNGGRRRRSASSRGWRSSRGCHVPVPRSSWPSCWGSPRAARRNSPSSSPFRQSLAGALHPDEGVSRLPGVAPSVAGFSSPSSSGTSRSCSSSAS